MGQSRPVTKTNPQRSMRLNRGQRLPTVLRHQTTTVLMVSADTAVFVASS